MRLCFVVQRYAPEIKAGAEMHCRWLAARLARRHQVEVVTTCSLDHHRWDDHFPAGRSVDDGIPVTRHAVTRPRDERQFALYSDIVFRDAHTADEERLWIEHNGPVAPGLVADVASRRDVDLFVFYSFRYYTTFHGLPPVRDRAVLVPTAEDDAAVRLPVFRDLLRAPRGILYLTPEERDLVHEVADNAGVASVVVGSGVNLPPAGDGPDARERFSLPARYVLYVGRVDWAKGVDRLVDHHVRLIREWPEAPSLVLAGQPAMPLPEHPGVRVLGQVSDQDKRALMSQAAVVVMPSRYESLSISVLEAWTLGRPVLVNAECRVLEGQCSRSNGGLFYRGYDEYAPALRLLLERGDLAQEIGRCGAEYVRREYDWDVVERRTQELLDRLAGAGEREPAP